MSYPPAKGEPILVPCEGSEDTDPHVLELVITGETLAMCRMCGAKAVLDVTGRMPAHQRDDVLARLERGDFD